MREHETCQTDNQMHFPDGETPLDETLKALDDLIHSGKVRYIGCSNYPAWLLSKALWTSEKLGLARFDCVQPRYNLLFRHIEAELFPLVLDQGIGVICYNPPGYAAMDTREAIKVMVLPSQRPEATSQRRGLVASCFPGS